MSYSRVVLLGGYGFVGSGIAAFAKFDRPLVRLRRDEADILSQSGLRAVLRPRDVVINAAGYANPADTSAEGNRRFQLLNVDGVRNIAAAARDVRCEQLIHMSSVAAMGRWEGDGVGENDLRPVRSPYARSKREAEEALLDYFDTLPITVLRPTSVFGEGRGLTHVLCRLASMPLVPLPLAGSARLPLTYVGNVAAGVASVVGNDRCYGQTYIVGDARSYSLRETLEILSAALGTKPVFVSVPYRIGAAGTTAIEGATRLLRRPPVLDRSRYATITTSVSYSIDKIVGATGYAPPYSIGQAMQRVAAWYRDRR